MTSPGMSRGIRRQAIIIVATLATAYVASHFFRAANVTIGLDLMRDLGIGPEALGAPSPARSSSASRPCRSPVASCSTATGRAGP
ncbi:hypothetical protein [Reyranella sp.]|uniref:hypothetical protein n=1 Tax=Reyranella sp. TaxID=1929291 RepID=UPI0040351DF7